MDEHAKLQALLIAAQSVLDRLAALDGGMTYDRTTGQYTVGGSIMDDVFEVVPALRGAVAKMEVGNGRTE